MRKKSSRRFSGMTLISLLPTAVVGPVFANVNHDSVSHGAVESAPSVAKRGSPGSAGRREAGMPLDALAEFPALPAQAQVKWPRWRHTYRPLVPSYARSEAAAETVIGMDARYRINPANSGHPERAIGLLTFDQGGSSFICTGWLINANTVATSGSLRARRQRRIVKHKRPVLPRARWGRITFWLVHQLRRCSPSFGWATNGNENFDYGAVKLNCSIGNTTGWFGYFWQAASLVRAAGAGVRISRRQGCQARTGPRAETSRSRMPQRLAISMTPLAEQSGGPVFETDRVRGVSVRACAPTRSPPPTACLTVTTGARINELVFNNLVNWSNAP